MSGLPERLARDFMAREQHHEVCAAALADLVRRALDEAAKVADDELNYESVAKRVREFVAASIEALK